MLPLGQLDPGERYCNERRDKYFLQYICAQLKHNTELCHVTYWHRKRLQTAILMVITLKEEVCTVYSIRMCTTVTYLYSTELCHVTYWYSIPGAVDQEKPP